MRYYVHQQTGKARFVEDHVPMMEGEIEKPLTTQAPVLDEPEEVYFDDLDS